MATLQQAARPALTSFYEIAGRVFSTRAFDDWSAHLAGRLIAGWHFAPLSAEPSVEADWAIEISRQTPPPMPEGLQPFEIPHGRCGVAGKTIYIEVEGALIRVHSPAMKLVEIWVDDAQTPSPVSLARLFFYATQAALRRCGLYELHAAGVSSPVDDTGALIIGASGSGKSTLAVRLALCGWRYLSDDTVLLREGTAGVEAHAFRRVFSLTEATLDACALPRVEEATRAPAEFDPDKRRVDPGVVFPSGFAGWCLPRALFFPLITGEAKSRVARMTQYEAMTELMKMCPWSCYDVPVAREHLSALSRLSKQCESYRLFSGLDILHEPEMAGELLKAHL